MFRYLGIFIVVLAITVAVVPHFTDCQSQGKMVTLANGNTTSMKCHWTGVAEIGAAIPLGVVGVAMIAGRRRETMMYMSFAGLAIAGVILALPNGLIGTCATPTMICNTLMKPALNLMGGLVGLTAAVGLVVAWRGKSLS